MGHGPTLPGHRGIFGAGSHLDCTAVGGAKITGAYGELGQYQTTKEVVDEHPNKDWTGHLGDTSASTRGIGF